MNISEIVNSYKTKSANGFIQAEIDDIVKLFPNLNRKKFEEALYGITCMEEDGETITYRIDIICALRCGTENRDLYDFEWD